MNPSKLKVVELRAELSARGLDTKGNKSVLVERLQEALDSESGGGGHKEEVAKGNQSPDAANESELNTTEQQLSDTQDQNEDTPTETQSTQENEMDRIEEETCDDQSQDQTNYEQPSKTEKENGENNMDDQGDNNHDQEPNHEKNDVENQPTEEMEDQHQNGGEDRHWESSQQDYPQDQEDNEKMDEDNSESYSNQAEGHKDKGGKEVKQEPLGDSGYDDVPMQGTPKEEKEKEGYESHVKSEAMDGNDTKYIKSENDIKTERDSHREDRKRKRSPSPSPYKSRQQSPVRQIKEEEPEIKETDVTLSWYDSDLNLMIDKDTMYTATPMTQGGFGFIWAGARGTYGYNSGKLCFQVKIIENCKVSHLENEPNPNVLRIGWSTFDTSMQLGEEPLSFGYGGTGKISVNCQFSNYGKAFGEGDIVTTYLDFQTTDFVISYSVNGEHLGVAWQLPLQELEDKPLAPHVLTKNVKFAVNFGQTEPWGEVDAEYTFVKNVPVDLAFAGPTRPEKRSDCEMIMMCGLPACGKTTWANEYTKEHPEKRYNILGTNALIDKMKVMGLPRKANYSGRWDILIDKCTKCLNKLMDVGTHRRRNYILDQTNVYPAAQRRKMRNFEGFSRKAVVIVPTDEEFKARTQKQAQQEKKDVPENAVMEMKANFCLPDKSLFSEIIYPELDENESKTLVHKYNKEAAAAGFARKGPIGGGGGGGGGGGSGGGRGGGGPNVKRFRGDFGHGGGQHGGGHQQHHGGGGGQRHDGFRRGPPPSSPFRSQYRGPPGGGGGHGGGGGGGGGGRGGWQPPRGTPDRWRDNRNHGGGSGGGGGGYRQGGGAGGDRGGGGWRGGNQGGNRGGNRDYETDRNSRGGNFGGDRNRGGRGGGGGGGGARDGGGRQGGGGGYSNRDSGRDNWNKRGGQGGGSGGGGGVGNLNSGSTGGSISTSNPQSNNQWGQYQSGGGQNQGQMTPAGGGQSWGTQQSWGNPQQQQQWGNYQQGWKGYNQTYSQGYNQQGYSQPTGYGNWQYGYPGYQNWGQNWQNWYQTQNAAAAGQTNTSQPPPSK